MRSSLATVIQLAVSLRACSPAAAAVMPPCLPPCRNPPCICCCFRLGCAREGAESRLPKLKHTVRIIQKGVGRTTWSRTHTLWVTCGVALDTAEVLVVTESVLSGEKQRHAGCS